MKKSLFVIFCFLVILASNVFAETVFDDSIGLGEEYKYQFENESLKISFEYYDAVNQAANFSMGQEVSLRLYESTNIGEKIFYFTGVEGSTSSDFKASYRMVNAPLKCYKECETDVFTGLALRFNVNVCRRELCSYKCDKFHKIKCINGTAWLVDSCNEEIQMNPNDLICDRDLEQEFIDRLNGCLSDESCNGYCISGICTQEEFIEGDNVCSLPLENCNSTDCSCSNDIIGGETNDYPLILVHGFTSKPETFDKLKKRLIADGQYIDGGSFPLEKGRCNEFILSDKKPVFAISYYEDLEEKNFYEHYFGEELLQSERKTPVDVMAENIEDIKRCTVSEKVDMIAHSNGGIIVRDYVLNEFNQKGVNKIVFLGTPNHGQVYGDQWLTVAPGLRKYLGDRKEFAETCEEKGVLPFLFYMVGKKDIGQECETFDEGKIYEKLNSVDETPGFVGYYTITGLIDNIGDGLTTVGSVRLNGAMNWIVECGHFDLKDPYVCPKAYDLILKALDKPERDWGENDTILFFVMVASFVFLGILVYILKKKK